jgi:hypothetical protein
MSLELLICPACQRTLKILQMVFTRGARRIVLRKCPACGYEWFESRSDLPVGPGVFDPLRQTLVP